jgi:signal transduction histidine kinase
VATPDDITDLPAALRSKSLQWSSTGFTALFGVGTALGVAPMWSGEDPGAFFAPLAVFIASAIAAVQSRRGQNSVARGVFVTTLFVYMTALMLFAPGELRLSIGFPIASLTLLLLHLTIAPPFAARLGYGLGAIVAAGFVVMFALDPSSFGGQVNVTATVAQLSVFLFANFVLDRLAHGWTSALDAVLLARAAQAEASHAKSVFLANMSHELRTPLNAVIGYAELAREQVEDEGTVSAGDLERIQRAGHHLLGLVNQVLDLSRIESGRIDLDPRPTDLAPLVREVCDSFAPTLQASATAIDLSLEPVPMLRLDPMRVRQIITNLVGNAAKFTRGGHVAVLLRGRLEGVELIVSDDGPGIPADRLEAIFQPFEQASSTVQRSFGGTGLGLAISRRLAREMAGDLRVESEFGAGSRFILMFPWSIDPDAGSMEIAA